MLTSLRQRLNDRLGRAFAQPHLPHATPFDLDLDRLPRGCSRSFGSANPERIFYVIWREGMGSGFFSNFAFVLHHLALADAAGMVPVVDFKNFKTLYNEPETLFGTDNAWEYYFRAVSNATLDEVYASRNVFFCSGQWAAGRSYWMAGIEGLRAIYRKYVTIQDRIAVRCDRYAGEFGQRVLGVHFRGQEQRWAPGHPLPATPKQMLALTDAIVERHSIERIFFVSEEQRYLDIYVRRYGNRVFQTDSLRTRDVNAYNMDPREHHRFLLGADVLVDALLLARCTGLLCAPSNVSEFAKFVNDAQYEFVEEIDNGLNSSNLLVARYLHGIQALLPRGLGGLPGRVVSYRRGARVGDTTRA